MGRRGEGYTRPKTVSCFLERPVGHSAHPETGQARAPQPACSSLAVAQLLRLPAGPFPPPPPRFCSTHSGLQCWERRWHRKAAIGSTSRKEDLDDPALLCTASNCMAKDIHTTSGPSLASPVVRRGEQKRWKSLLVPHSGPRGNLSNKHRPAHSRLAYPFTF